MPNEFSSTLSSPGLLKNYYDSGDESPTSAALEKKRKKARLNQMGDLGVSDDPGKQPDSIDPNDK